MRITGPHVGSVSEIHIQPVKSTTPAASASATGKADSVELSGDASAMQAAREVIAQTPDARMERVEALRRQIEAGTYEVSALDIAEKMLAEGRLSGLGR